MPLRALHKKTMQTLGAPHTLPTLTVTLLFCLLSGTAALLFCKFTRLLALLFLSSGEAELLRFTLRPILAVLLAVLLVMPLWLGRLRMAGLLLAEEKPLYRECFYYFKRPARYARAVGTSAVIAFFAILFGFGVFGVFAGAVLLYRAVLLVYLPRVAFLLFFVALQLAIAAAAGLLYLAGYLLPFAAIAVGNEEISVAAALARALRVGRRQSGKSFVFALWQLLWLVLSLLSVMVLYVLWYSHYFNLIYLRYSMTLTEDFQ